MDLKKILNSFEENFGLYPCFGIEFEFFSYNISKLYEKIDDFSSFQLKKENHDHQYELIFMHNANILRTVDLFTEVKNKILDIICLDDFINEKFGGLHIHITLLNTKHSNIFDKIFNKDIYFLYTIGGLLDLMLNSIGYFFPNKISMKRLQNPDFFTPTTISWGNNNRTTALRIPESNSENRRIEHRVASNHADITKVLYVIILAMGFGLKNKILPKSPKIFGNAFDVQYQLQKIPNNRNEIRKIIPIDQIIDWRTFEKIQN